MTTHMGRPTYPFARLALRLTGLVLLLLCCAALASGAFFAAALVFDAPWGAAGAAVLVLLLTVFSCGYWCGPGLGWPSSLRLRFSLGMSVLLLLVGALGTWWAVFRPVDVDLARVHDATEPAFWDLPTGSRIGYSVVRARGTAHDSPVVYLHGGPAVPPRNSVRSFLSPLADDGFEIYVYDQFGSGRSSRAGSISDYTLQRQVADLEAIRQQLGVARLVLVGSSWGAVLAGYYMAAHPERVERAVLLSPGVLTRRNDHRYDFSRSASSDDSAFVLPPLRLVVAGALARLNPTLAERFASQAEMGSIFDRFTSGPSLEYQSHCKGRFSSRVGDTGSSRAGGGNYYANLLTLDSLRKAPDPTPALRVVQAPVLLLRGDCDYIPLSSALAWKQALPTAILVRIPDAGHALTSSAPQETFSAMRSFLRQAPVLPLQDRGSTAARPTVGLGKGSP